MNISEETEYRFSLRQSAAASQVWQGAGNQLSRSVQPFCWLGALPSGQYTVAIAGAAAAAFTSKSNSGHTSNLGCAGVHQQVLVQLQTHRQYAEFLPHREAVRYPR